MTSDFVFYDPGSKAIRLNLKGLVRARYGPDAYLSDEVEGAVVRALSAFIRLPREARTLEDFTEFVESILADHLGDPPPAAAPGNADRRPEAAP